MMRAGLMWRGGRSAVLRLSRLLSAYGWAAVSITVALMFALVAMFSRAA